MAEGAIIIPRFVSPKQPIRLALGKLGYSNLMQTLEPDLIAWSIEAQDLISKKKTMQPTTMEVTVENNQVPHCSDWLLIDAVKTKSGYPLTYKGGGSVAGCVTDNCKKVCCGSDQGFTVDTCYTSFTPAMADGATLDITYYKRPTDSEGYPMIAEVCVLAVTEYIKWQLCFRQGDNRHRDCERRWLILCKQARGLLNVWTRKKLSDLGYVWYG